MSVKQKTIEKWKAVKKLMNDRDYISAGHLMVQACAYCHISNCEVCPVKHLCTGYFTLFQKIGRSLNLNNWEDVIILIDELIEELEKL